MRTATTPSFDTLEKLSGSMDADLTLRSMVSPNRNRGRGAQSNISGRFEREKVEAFDDGWSSEDPLPVFKTVEHVEKARSIISRNQSPDIGFDRSINPYRGCEHGCSYCYARPTHAFIGLSAGIDFERELYVKVNAAEELRRELSSQRYKCKPIAIGTNTDPYQPIERQRKVMRGLLEVLLETKHPVTITTKSALVVRDLDLLTELAKLNLVSVALSITTLDAKLSNKMEPRASSPVRRLEALKLLSAAGVPTTVMVAPIIPAINDAEIERILDAASAQGVVSASMVMLRLPGEVRNIFREWLLRHFPHKLRHVMSLVRDVRGGKDNDSRFGSRMRGEGPYAVMIRQRFEKAVERNGLAKKGVVLRTDLFDGPKVEDNQLNLF